MEAALTNRMVALLFDRVAKEYDRLSNPYTMRRRAEALAAHVHGASLEVGGGTGAVTACLSDRSRAWHSDIAPAMCRVASSRLGCPSLCFDAEAIPLADECLDTAVGSEMIYYLERPRRFLQEAYRILRPGGRLLLSSTNPVAAALERGRSLLRKIGLKHMFFDDGSPGFIRLSLLRKMLADVGFSIEKTQGIVLAPFARLHALNCILERTLLQRLGLFLIVVARK